VNYYSFPVVRQGSALYAGDSDDGERCTVFCVQLSITENSSVTPSNPVAFDRPLCMCVCDGKILLLQRQLMTGELSLACAMTCSWRVASSGWTVRCRSTNMANSAIRLLGVDKWVVSWSQAFAIRICLVAPPGECLQIGKGRYGVVRWQHCVIHIWATLPLPTHTCTHCTVFQLWISWPYLLTASQRRTCF